MSIKGEPLAVAGDLSVSSGATFFLVGSGFSTINFNSGVKVGGNFSNAGTFSTVNAAINLGQQLYFSGSGPQTFSNTGTFGSGSNRVNLTLSAGSTLDMGTSAFTGIGTFTTQTGSTLRLGSPDGIGTSGTTAGNVRSTGTYGGSFEFNGTAAQNMGTGFPATVGTSLTLTTRLALRSRRPWPLRVRSASRKA